MRACDEIEANPLFQRLGACKNEEAQALVEFALTLCLLVVLLTVAVEVGRMGYASIEVVSAAKAGAQYASRSSAAAADLTGIQTAAQNDASDLILGTTTVTFSYLCSDGSSVLGTPPSCSTGGLETILTVDTQATLIPLFSVQGFPGSYVIRGQAIQKCMRC
jgi:hypothetical protein